MLNLCCLFGGESTEYDVSLSSVTSVIENYDRTKYNLTLVGITRDGKWYLYEGPIERSRQILGLKILPAPPLFSPPPRLTTPFWCWVRIPTASSPST